MTNALGRILAFILSPLAALSARGQEMLPAGYDPHDDVFYQFMPIAWRASEARGAAASAAGPDADMPVEMKYRFGDFKGMTESLDYLAGLGITGVWMTPIFPSRAYHSYQHGAADQVNPWFGTEQEFVEFVKAAHARKIKVYIDLVAYGISQDSRWFADAVAESGADAAWIAGSKDEKLLKPGPVWRAKSGAGGGSDGRLFQGYDFKTWTGETIGIAWWDLRQDGPRDLVTSWCRKWMDPNGDGDFADGIDGFRLDHVWSKYQAGPGGWGYTVRDFWVPWKKDLQKVNPKVFTFAEQAKWETRGEDLLPAHDAAFAKPLLFAIREAITSGKAAPLAKEMVASLKAIPEGRTLLGSIGDHDVDRVASAIGEPAARGSGAGAGGEQGKDSADGANASDAASTAGADRENLERAKLAAAILLLQPLPPVIYFGDEIGMLGKAGNFHSDANDIPRREPFKWTAEAPPGNSGSPMTDYHRLHEGAYAKRYSHDRDGRSVEEQLGKSGSLLETYKELIRLRRENVALRRGDYMPIKIRDGVGGSGDAESVWCFARVHERQKLLIAVNLSATERIVSFTREKDVWHGTPIGPWKAETGYEVLGTQSEISHRVTLPGWGTAIVELEVK